MFIVVPKAQADRIRKAFAKLEGLPRRATIMRNGVPDEALSAQLADQLQTTDCTPDPDEDGTTAAIELPQSLEKHLGKTVTIAGKSITLPTANQLAADESALPDTIKAIRQARRDASQAAISP